MKYIGKNNYHVILEGSGDNFSVNLCKNIELFINNGIIFEIGDIIETNQNLSLEDDEFGDCNSPQYKILSIELRFDDSIFQEPIILIKLG